jgi:hypothetical protein
MWASSFFADAWHATIIRLQRAMLTLLSEENHLLIGLRGVSTAGICLMFLPQQIFSAYKVVLCPQRGLGKLML